MDNAVRSQIDISGARAADHVARSSSRPGSRARRTRTRRSGAPSARGQRSVRRQAVRRRRQSRVAQDPGHSHHRPCSRRRRTVMMVRDQVVLSNSGKLFPRRIDTMCAHGDEPTAHAVASETRRALEAAGVHLAPLPELIPSAVKTSSQTRSLPARPIRTSVLMVCMSTSLRSWKEPANNTRHPGVLGQAGTMTDLGVAMWGELPVDDAPPPDAPSRDDTEHPDRLGPHRSARVRHTPANDRVGRVNPRS